MAFGSFDKGASAPMADINTTPLVDVMLVLLVVFIITTPLLTNTVKLDLPQASAAAQQSQPKEIRLAIDAAGAVFWNDVKVPEGELDARFAAAARDNPQVELHLFADKSVRYETVAKTLASAQQGGISKIGFATEAP
ncbi:MULTISPECIES: ExbD/TolR family protein [Chromobacterium]|uniref:Biopolymer transporter ExbD n=1 Tax=Chromobacterium haemolyticum TaxID=394935 RepID=A0A1W0CB53_9NEIS|nr:MULTISPECIES: biopolymer transporter ExbD [Chromobacterium]MBK0415872.1 biopolymer transporter ExbD [Chromobacterium haemolyticum]MBO0417179.1 biopolymer transporter ExbD [Chromobacterium haemolyticum]MBO0500259.1 biopolymer transporter ExbD [Chromobacterium haemolyticum]MDH0341558.1 biopolymer transporter ExbD [Chromobacterium haemolyticum]OQS31984.1 biopolymer transporter ExbD [Chromobacterium haemolyticum]